MCINSFSKVERWFGVNQFHFRGLKRWVGGKTPMQLSKKRCMKTFLFILVYAVRLVSLTPLSLSQPQDIRYHFLHSFRLTPDPFCTENQEVRNCSDQLSWHSRNWCLCPACLDDSTPLPSLSSRTNKLCSFLKNHFRLVPQHSGSPAGQNRAKLICSTQPAESDGLSLVSVRSNTSVVWWLDLRFQSSKEAVMKWMGRSTWQKLWPNYRWISSPHK